MKTVSKKDLDKLTGAGGFKVSKKIPPKGGGPMDHGDFAKRMVDAMQSTHTSIRVNAEAVNLLANQNKLLIERSLKPEPVKKRRQWEMIPYRDDEGFIERIIIREI